MSQRNEKVEKELEKLVGVLIDVVPQLTEVRVFGSYNNGNWKPEKSDVDVFVETGDENYNSSNINFFKNREEIRNKIRQKMKGSEYQEKFSICLWSSKAVKIVKQVNYPMAGIIKEARLLYSSQEVAT